MKFHAIVTDSRLAGPHDLFVAQKGTQFDSHTVIPELYQKGVRYFVGESPCPAGVPPEHYFQVPDSREALAELASEFYGNPSHGMQVIGVTGTSGKTTTTFLIESILLKAGRNVGLIGTVVFRTTIGKTVTTIPSTHTTPGPLELQALLKQMKDSGCDTVVMEVSSHALKQHRVSGVAFDRAMFLNLSPEHLDYHPTMEDYLQSKRMLFTHGLKTGKQSGKDVAGFLNADSEAGRTLDKFFKKANAPWLSVSLFSRSRFKFQPVSQGLTCEWEGKSHLIPLFGEFNAENLSAAFTVAESLGVGIGDAIRSVESGIRVPGRLERVPGSGDAAGRHPSIFVDYAHKPDALEKVLLELKRILPTTSELWVVFGCGGDRDKTKRPVMGEIAARLADRVVVTSDNPRTEDPDTIIKEVEAGTRHANLRHPIQIEADRKMAIQTAVRSAKAQDWILIAGKGHEDYQIIADPASPGGTKKVHFDDLEVASLALTLRNQ